MQKLHETGTTRCTPDPPGKPARFTLDRCARCWGASRTCRALANDSDNRAFCALRVLRGAPLGHRWGRTLRGAGPTCRALTNDPHKSRVRLSHGSRHHPQRRTPAAVRARSPGSAIRCGILRVVLWQSLTDVSDRLVVGGRSGGSLGGVSWLFARVGSCDRRSGRIR